MLCAEIRPHLMAELPILIKHKWNGYVVVAQWLHLGVGPPASKCKTVGRIRGLWESIDTVAELMTEGVKGIFGKLG